MNTRRVSSLLDTLVQELERPRELPAQVAGHLASTYDIGRDAIGRFLTADLLKLEDYELDLILSPVFTPGLNDQAIFARLLGRDSIPRQEWPALVRQLFTRPTRAQLVTADGSAHSVSLREVSIERYVHRLRLDGAVPDALFQLINDLAPVADRPLLKAVARRAIWNIDGRHQILLRYLTQTVGSDSYRMEDVSALLRLAETYQPSDAADLLTRIPRWQQVLRHGIDVAADPKPFFNERVQELHGGGRDQRPAERSRIDAKQNELAFLDRLKGVLAG